MTRSTPPQLTKPSDAEWPPEHLEHLGQCPVCKSTDRRVLYSGLTDRLFGCAPGKWTLHKCAECACAYLDPRPDIKSIGQAYKQYFTHETSEPRTGNDTNLSSATPWRQRVRMWLRAGLNGYRNKRWGMALTPSNAWGRWWVPLVWPLKSVLVTQMRNLPRQLPRPGATLRDVGCGNGDFLIMARAAGWQVQGVDFDPLAVETARKHGLNVHHGGLEQLTQHHEHYDWITCSHVVEHVHDPVQWLRDMYVLLRPGGTLWLQTPNINSLGLSRFGVNWRGLEPPRHLVIFDLRCLLQKLRECGFQPQTYQLPALSAMAVYAASEALRDNRNATLSLRLGELLRLSYLVSAVQQAVSVQNAEFITITATKERRP